MFPILAVLAHRTAPQKQLPHSPSGKFKATDRAARAQPLARNLSKMKTLQPKPKKRKRQSKVPEAPPPRHAHAPRAPVGPRGPSFHVSSAEYPPNQPADEADELRRAWVECRCVCDGRHLQQGAWWNSSCGRLRSLSRVKSQEWTAVVQIPALTEVRVFIPQASQGRLHMRFVRGLAIHMKDKKLLAWLEPHRYGQRETL